jgi:hypothetical protein
MSKSTWASSEEWLCREAAGDDYQRAPAHSLDITQRSVQVEILRPYFTNAAPLEVALHGTPSPAAPMLSHWIPHARPNCQEIAESRRALPS